MSDSKKIEEERKKGEEMEKKIRRWILPLIILILIITFWFSFKEPSNIENPDSDMDSNTDSNTYPEVYKFPKTLIIGKNWSYNFSNHLMPFIQEKNTSAPYTFYINSESGTLPDGLVFNANGMLSGKPTGKSGTYTFEVCVEDSSRNIVCKIYKLNVASEIDENRGETQVPSEGESKSSWTGTYTIELMNYIINSYDCKNIITGDIHFEITQKSNGNVEGIITTKNDKESKTPLDGELSICVSYLTAPLYGEGEKAGEQIPFWFNGRVNDAGGLNIEYFEIHMFEFINPFTANRVGDTLTGNHTESYEYEEKDIYTLTFSVTKDAK